MASSKAPKHDFAPAWLKIPDEDSQKAAGLKSAEQAEKGRSRREDYYNSGYGRYGGTDYGYAPLQRQRSFENYYDDRRYVQKFRHHSVDDDYYGGAYSYGPSHGPGPYYNGYSYEKYSSHYRSQPSLYRDGKYTHPNARFSQVTGAYPPYYDSYAGYDYYPGETYYGYMRPPPGSKRHSGNDREGKVHSKGERDKESKQKDSAGHNAKGDNLDDDFPSLNGDAENTESKPSSTAGGVWEKPLNTKGMSNGICNLRDVSPQNNHDSSSRDVGKSNKTGSVFKALVPNKNSLPKRQGKDGWKTANNKELNSSTNPAAGISSQDALNDTQPTSDLLSTRLVTQSKNVEDKKGDFLKAINDTNSHHPEEKSMKERSQQQISSTNVCASNAVEKTCINNSQQHDDSLVNGFDDLRVDAHNDVYLSNSLEEEQRLLKEMGWNEMDNEDDYIITEEDVREFQKMKEIEQQRSSLKRVLPDTWSPQHLPVFQGVVIDDTNDTLSSTSEESDLTVN